MNDSITLIKNYDPKDYWDSYINIKIEDFKVEFNCGKIIISIPDSVYYSKSDILDEIDLKIKLFAMGLHAARHKRLFISDDYVFARGNYKEYSTKSMRDVSGFDSSLGNSTHDSRIKQIEDELSFAISITSNQKYFNKIKTILVSYINAIENPEKELVYLFEITESIKHEFGSINRVCKNLKINRADWYNITKPANNPEITPGRYSGLNNGNELDAPNDEISKARNAAKKMIIYYNHYLNNPPAS